MVFMGAHRCVAWLMCVYACVTAFIHASHTCIHPDTHTQGVRNTHREIGAHMHVWMM